MNSSEDLMRQTDVNTRLLTTILQKQKQNNYDTSCIIDKHQNALFENLKIIFVGFVNSVFHLQDQITNHEV